MAKARGGNEAHLGKDGIVPTQVDAVVQERRAERRVAADGAQKAVIFEDVVGCHCDHAQRALVAKLLRVVPSSLFLLKKLKDLAVLVADLARYNSAQSLDDGNSVLEIGCG